MHTKNNSSNSYEKIEAILASLTEDDQQIINVYHQIRINEGYVPQEALKFLETHFDCTESEQQGFLSFFDAFRSRPPAEHTVSICYGTACYAKRAPLLYNLIAAELHLDEEGYSADDTIRVNRVYCVGACSQAPLVIQDGQISGKLKSHRTRH